MKFFIDTSVLINAGPNLSSRKLGVLRDQLRSKQVAMVTCQVVIDECVNKFSETIARRRIEILNAVNELKKAVGQEFLISIPDYQLEEWVSSYRSTIEQIFEGEGSYILPYPEVSHEEIVHRAMRGTKPYNKGKKDGYRDTLIWFSILEELKNEPDKDICIVTANLSDFGQIVDGRAIPEEQLTLDLTSRGYRKDSLKLLTSLEAIVKIHIEYQISMLGEVKEAILSKSWSERKLEQDVESAIEDYFLAFPLYDYPLNTLPSGASIDYQDIMLVDNVDYISIEVSQGTLGGYSIVADVLAKCIFEVEVEMQSDSFGELREISHMNEHSTIGERAFYLPCKVSFVFDLEWDLQSVAVSVNAPSEFEVLYSNW